MFLKYKIMKSLKCESSMPLDALYDSLKIKNKITFVTCLSSLANDGFIIIKNQSVSLRDFSSFLDYKRYISKSVFNYIVSGSAIIVALTSILELFQ